MNTRFTFTKGLGVALVIGMLMAAVVLVFSPLSASSVGLSPAHHPGNNTMAHITDDGYDNSIIVKCNSTVFGVTENSTTYGICDVDEVYNRYGEEIHCKRNDNGEWYTFATWHGWRDFGDVWQRKCVLQLQ